MSFLRQVVNQTTAGARWVVLSLAVLGLRADAQNRSGQCGELAKAWTTACSAASGLKLEPQTCLPGRLVVAADLGADGTLKIDITRDSSRFAVTHGGGAAFAPIGSFRDWASEPAARRDAVEALARCADRDPSLLSRAEQDARGSPGRTASRAFGDSSRLISDRSLVWLAGGLAAIAVLAGLIRGSMRSK
jgi:hypothetical protein